jgi:succinyl-diaminopimelate desuccinylase
MHDSLATLRLAEQLIACESNTPHDAGCMDIIAARLEPLGFELTFIDSGPETFRVRNLWAKRSAFLEQKEPLAGVNSAQTATENIAKKALAKTLVFAGHTDVVPTGAARLSCPHTKMASSLAVARAI